MLTLLLALALCANSLALRAEPLALRAEPLPAGSSKIELDLDGTRLEAFVHKPAGATPERMLLVFHGIDRNADEYRDHAIVLGERYRMLVVAPRFDAERFPSRAYQRGGLLKEDGSAAEAKEWTWAFVPKVAAAVRAREGRPQMPYWLIGHSAGGQFCMRMAAFQATGAERIVAANPGTALFPTRDMDYGLGFGGLPPELASDERLRAYLAAPLVLYLGRADDHADEWLDTSPAAMRQGASRLERNRAAFVAGYSLAQEKGWKFNWSKIEIDGVGHDHEAMFAHPDAESALFGIRRADLGKGDTPPKDPEPKR